MGVRCRKQIAGRPISDVFRKLLGKTVGSGGRGTHPGFSTRFSISKALGLGKRSSTVMAEGDHGLGSADCLGCSKMDSPDQKVIGVWRPRIGPLGLTCEKLKRIAG